MGSTWPSSDRSPTAAGPPSTRWRRSCRHPRSPPPRARSSRSSDREMKVGFIGLGVQGGPMARQVIDHGYDVTLWARRDATLEPFRDSGCNLARSPTELGAACDLVGI